MLGVITAALAAPPVGMVPSPEQTHVQLTETVLPTQTVASFTTLEGGGAVYRTSSGSFGIGLSGQVAALGVFVPGEERSWFGPQSGAIGAWILMKSTRVQHGLGLIGHLGARREGLYALVAHPRSSGVTIGYRLSASIGERLTLGVEVDGGINTTTALHVGASPWVTVDLGHVALHARLTGAFPQELSAVSTGASLQIGRVDLAAMVHGVGSVWDGGPPFHVLPQLTLRYQLP